MKIVIQNKYSKINKIKENNYEWICEFGNFKNEIHNTQIKIPESSMKEYNIFRIKNYSINQ